MNQTKSFERIIETNKYLVKFIKKKMKTAQITKMISLKSGITTLITAIKNHERISGTRLGY